MYKYTKIQGPRFQRNNIIARDQKSDLHSTSFQSSPKINRMLITRPFAYNKSLQHPTIAVLLIKIRIFFFDHLVVFTCSKVINAFNDRIREPTLFGKALLSFLRETCVASITQRFLFPVSTVPEKSAWHNDPLLCPKYNEKRVADYESRCSRKRDLKNCNNLAVNKDKLAYVKYNRHI